MTDLKGLFTDDDAVSPVIGVILMVAITVILAAVIGAFVLGIGSSQEQSPNASLEFQFTTDGSGNNVIGMTHEGGDSIDGDTLSVTLAGTEIWDADDGGPQTSSSNVVSPAPTDDWSGSDVTAGDTLELKDDASATTPAPFASGTVQIVWSSASSDSSQVLASAETSF